jgi:hypothetical protein
MRELAFQREARGSGKEKMSPPTTDELVKIFAALQKSGIIIGNIQ